MAEIDLDAREIAKDITMTVSLKGVKTTALRLWITIRLLKIVGWICPCDFRIEDENGDVS